LDYSLVKSGLRLAMENEALQKQESGSWTTMRSIAQASRLWVLKEKVLIFQYSEYFRFPSTGRIGGASPVGGQ
jgi:hypothetical protein